MLVNIVQHPELFEGFLSLQSTEQSVSKDHGDEQPTIGKDRFVRFGVIVLSGDPEEFKMGGCAIWTRIENDILPQFPTFSYYLLEKVHEIINMDIGHGGLTMTSYDP